MKPVAIFRFSRTEGQGYFATFLDAHEIPWKLFALDSGDSMPGAIGEFSGFGFMGGPMSANDDLAWIPPILDLIRAAAANDQPCIGHCLGGQLMARALGGTVTVNPVKEIGWHEVTTCDNIETRAWLGDAQHFTVFQWHGDTFSLPPGASRILTGPHCANQAYVLGKHLGMQCHVEMTPEMIAAWCHDGASEIETALHQGQQTVIPAAAIETQTESRLPRLRKLSDRLYYQWVAGLRFATDQLPLNPENSQTARAPR